MSNYTIAVAWSGKDALSDSDANKVISGADFNTEFTVMFDHWKNSKMRKEYVTIKDMDFHIMNKDLFEGIMNG